MKTRLLVIASLALCLFVPRTPAQDPPKKPGPEQKNLEMFTGRWKFVEVSTENPFWPVGTVSVKTESRMILDGYFFEERAAGVGPGGPISWLWLIGWDDEKKQYQGTFFENSGFFHKDWKNESIILTLQGRTWSGKWNSEKDGKQYPCRSSTTIAPDGKSCHYQFEYSDDGTQWKVFMTGKGKKVGSTRPR